MNYPKHSVVTATVAWAQYGSQFTKGFKDAAAGVSRAVNTLWLTK